MMIFPACFAWAAGTRDDLQTFLNEEALPTTMSYESDKELDRLHDQYLTAWYREIPNLVEVRRCAEELADLMAERMLTGDGRIEVRTPEPAPLRLVQPAGASRTEARGPSSPIKSEEILELERLARKLFGDSVVCTTEWD